MKTIEAIQFDTANDQIIVTYDDESSATYAAADAVRYIEENPGREADVIAMGWET